MGTVYTLGQSIRRCDKGGAYCKDTALSPEALLGENPPAGAVIDCWLGAAPKTTLTLKVRDGKGGIVARFASDGGSPNSA